MHCAEGGGDVHLYIGDKKGRLARQVSASQGQNLCGAWAPNSRTLAYQVKKTDAGRWQVWEGDLYDASKTRCLLQSTRYAFAHPCYTPDAAGLWVVSDQGCEGQALALWRLDLATGDKLQLTHPTDDEQHLCPSPQPDANRLLYCACPKHHTGGALRLLDLSTQHVQALGSPHTSWRSARFLTPDLIIGRAKSPEGEGLCLLHAPTGREKFILPGDARHPTGWRDPQTHDLKLVWSQPPDPKPTPKTPSPRAELWLARLDNL